MSETEVWLPRPGDRVGRYQILAPLAEGGMAAVYVAELASMAGVERRFALKVPLPRLRQEPDALSMFLDEARIAARVVHRNVAQVFELGEHAGTPYIVMELIEGQPLSALVARARNHGGLEREILLRVIAEAARGLHAAHEATAADGTPLAIVHRDVSPQNIHIGYDGAVKLVDFGIARAHGRLTKTESGRIKGKYRYLAPEQVNGLPVDRRADVWALGVILWELVARTALFRNDEEAATLWNILNKTVPSLRSVVPDVPDALDAITLACLERDPDRRAPDAARVADALEPLAASSAALAAAMRRFFDGEQIESRQQLTLRETPAAAAVVPRRTRWWIAGVAAIATSLLLALLWKLAPSDDTHAASIVRPRAAIVSNVVVPAAAPPPQAPTPAVVSPEPAAVQYRRARPHPRPSEPAPSAAARPADPLLDNPYH